MYRYIYSANQSDKFNAGVWINKVGKYLKKNIDGAYKVQFNPMDCEVWMRMYYQTPGQVDTFSEIKFSIDITSYANKLRINITEQTQMEKTIGQIILQPEQLNDLNIVRAMILEKIQKFIAKEYADYDFVY